MGNSGKMPVSLPAELLHYAEYLQENLTQDKSLIKSHMDKLKDTCDESLKDIDEEDFFSLAGLWQDREISIESIRKQAWLDRNK